MKKSSLNFEQFDLFKFLDQYNINYTERGKNIGVTWIGLDECPFCGIPGNHFGINVQSKNYSCFGCSASGNLISLVKDLLRVSFGDAINIIQKFYNGDLEFIPREVGKEVILPSNITDLMTSGGAYLKSRNFNPYYIRDKYQIKQTGNYSMLEHEGTKSDFKYRLIIPIYMYRELVSYTARDYTRKQEPKYKHVFLEACRIPPSSCIYNLDTVKDRCIILEGPTDVWRMGDGCVSLQGIQHTTEQIRHLAEAGIKKAVIMFDAGKEEEAKKLARILSGVIKTVQVAHLPEGDPGELSDIDALKIKHQLLGR